MQKIKIIFAFILIPTICFSQNWEIGLVVGGSNYQGDIAPNIAISETHFASGFFFKRNLSKYFSSTFLFMQCEISGNDNNYDYLQLRNLDFRTSITELSYQLEFNFFPFSLGLHPNNYTPYVFTGISVFKFEPQTIYNGEMINLHALDTEGKILTTNSSYSLYQMAIPIGGGFKIKVTPNFNCAINLGFRYAFTDYIDDVSTTYYDAEILEDNYGKMATLLSDKTDNEVVSFNGKQRGRQDYNDWYIIGGITISYRIKNAVCYF